MYSSESGIKNSQKEKLLNNYDFNFRPFIGINYFEIRYAKLLIKLVFRGTGEPGSKIQ